MTHVVDERLARPSNQEHAGGEPPHILVLEEGACIGIDPVLLVAIILFLPLVLIIRSNPKPHAAHESHEHQAHSKKQKHTFDQQHARRIHKDPRDDLGLPQRAKSKRGNGHSESEPPPPRKILRARGDAGEVHGARAHSHEAEGDDHEPIVPLTLVGKSGKGISGAKERGRQQREAAGPVAVADEAEDGHRKVHSQLGRYRDRVDLHLSVVQALVE